MGVGSFKRQECQKARTQWMGEPAQATRIRVGVWVLLFLGVLTVFVWRLNAAYWRGVT